MTRPLRPAARRTAASILALAGVLLAAGCVEERIISRRGLISSLPGAKSNIPDDRVARQADILRTPNRGIRQTDEDGNVTLYAKSVQHLMTHLVHAIQNDERDLFVEQILSEKTRDEFRFRGYDPATAFDEIVRRQRDVFTLFNTMPFGERTPGLMLEATARNEFRLRLPRSSWGDLKWTGIDSVFEDGNYHLRWFVAR